MTIQIRRTRTPNNPPLGLMPGQLAVEMASHPARLWCGVPFDIDPTGRVLLGYAGGGSNFSTGDAKLTLKRVADPGWIMCDDGSIGRVEESGADHFGDEYGALFAILFVNIADAYAPIRNSDDQLISRENLPGGINQAWTAVSPSYRVALTRQLGRAIVIAGAGLGLTQRNLGEFFGEESHTPTIAEMVQHLHGVNNPGHGHPGSASGAQTISAGYHYADQSDIHAYSPQWGGASDYAWANAAAAGVSLSNTGSTQPFNVMQASCAWNIMMKL